MYYLFIDESQRENRLSLCGLIVRQDRYTACIDTISLQSQKKRLRTIHDFLGHLGGWALILRGDVGGKLSEVSHDGYADVQHISRRDNVWSRAVIRAIQAAVVRLERVKGEVITVVDVYHDPKSLTDDHRKAMYQYITEEAANMFRRLYQRRGARRLKDARIRRITSVEKAEKKSRPDKFQRGIQLADALLKQHDFRETKNIEVIDITRHLQQIFEADMVAEEFSNK